MGYSFAEQETSLVFNYETKQWLVYSTVPKHIRRLMDIGEMEIIEEENGRAIAVRGTLNEKQVSMKKERVYTEEQKRQMAERLRKAREAQLSENSIE